MYLCCAPRRVPKKFDHERSLCMSRYTTPSLRSPWGFPGGKDESISHENCRIKPTRGLQAATTVSWDAKVPHCSFLRGTRLETPAPLRFSADTTVLQCCHYAKTVNLLLSKKKTTTKYYWPQPSGMTPKGLYSSLPQNAWFLSTYLPRPG